MSDKELLDLLGLSDRQITVGVDLEQDLQYVIENGIEKYLQKREEQENKKREFIEMFKECYDELCEFMDADPLKRIAISCFTCQRGLELRDKYGSGR